MTPRFRHSALRFGGAFIVAFLAATASTAVADHVNVLTQHNDNARTGQNPKETKLHPRTLSFNTFGKLFTQPVDGQVYAQPLYMASVQIAGMSHSVIFVAT